MLPPIRKENAEIDMDSDTSDDMNDGVVHHLPRRLLNSTCDSSLLEKGNKQKSVQHTQQPIKKSSKSDAENWEKKALTFSQVQLEASTVPEEWKEITKSPIDACKPMFSDDLVLHVTNQTNIYTVQHGKGNLDI